MPTLSEFRVLELAAEIAGPYAGKLLADAGCEVIKIEHPDVGDPLRRWTACGAEPAPGVDAPLFRFLNQSKQSVALDQTTSAGHARLLALLASADVVLDDGTLDLTTLQTYAPHTASVSITPFGRTGPWRDRPATEFTLQAWCGSIAARGEIERPPLAAGGRIGEWLGGSYAALAALTALIDRRRTGRAPHIDLSLLEVMHLSMVPFATLAHRLSGPDPPVLPRNVEIPSIAPTADGYVGFCTITNQQWRDFLVLIERGDLVDDPELAHYRTRNERRHEVHGFINAWTRTRTTAEIIERATLLRIPVAPIGDGATVTAFEHFRERAVYQPLAGSPALCQPRPPFRLSRGRLASPTPAPRLGTHDPQARPLRVVTPTDPPATVPFAGLRVLDMTVFWAGPFVGHYLAALGADVVKLESIQRPDGIRFASTQQPGADRWWEWSALFLGINANKRGLTLDMSRPAGLALAKQLIASVDVVIENFSPRVLDNLGLHYDDLARTNPRLIMVRMPAFGLDGPWRDRTGFAQTMEQVSGMAWVTGFADGAPVIPRGPCDPLAGLHACFALLLALEHRRTTGEGQLVESTMVEAALNATADQTLEWQTFGRSATRDGNHGPVAAPQNLYACRGGGENGWLALAIATDAHWRALRAVLGDPEWAAAEGLDTAAGRRRAHGQIDAELSAWCARYERGALLDRLLAAGIPAAPVVAARTLEDNPQLAARGFFTPIAHPVVGEHAVPGLPLRYSAHPAPWVRQAAPTLGQDTTTILQAWLDVDDDTLTRLHADGIIGDRPTGA